MLFLPLLDEVNEIEYLLLYKIKFWQLIFYFVVKTEPEKSST